MAYHSIAEPFAARPPKPSSLARSHGAVVCLARQAARRAVSEDLRAQGLRPMRMRAAEIERLAREYLAKHPQLKLDAFQRACRMRLIDPKDEDILRLALLTSEP